MGCIDPEDSGRLEDQGELVREVCHGDAWFFEMGWAAQVRLVTALRRRLLRGSARMKNEGASGVTPWSPNRLVTTESNLICSAEGMGGSWPGWG